MTELDKIIAAEAAHLAGCTSSDARTERLSKFLRRAAPMEPRVANLIALVCLVVVGRMTGTNFTSIVDDLPGAIDALKEAGNG